MHVYHYGAYEPTALKQLMGVYATREDAVDALLRREVFVDLHSVVRQGLRAGVPGYSLKDVEALPEFRRQAELASGTRAVLAYEEWMHTGAAGRLAEMLEYHRREARPAWWWFFARCSMSLDELVEDGEAISRIQPEGAPRRVGSSLHHRFSFPAQQHKLGPGDTPIDPVSGKGAGTIMEMDEVEGPLVLRRGARL